MTGRQVPRVRAARRAPEIVLVTSTFVAVVPQSLLACPVCFGAADSPVINGMNMAILVLLGVTVSVLAAFGAFIVRLSRRARLTGGRPRAAAVVQGGHR